MLNTIQKERLKKEVNATWELATGTKDPVDSNVEMLIDYLTEDDFKCYGALYQHATEDMRSYYKAFDKVERFLTIGASGDQLLNAVSMGAKKIDVFDKNCLSKRGCALKVASVKTLSNKDLIAYFFSHRNNLYQRVSPKLTEEDLTYWNSVYDILSESEIQARLFAYRYLGQNIIRSINPYLDDENYALLKDQLEDVEINYIDAPLEALGEKIQGKEYDAINLSNIYEYINFRKNTSMENAQNFHDYIMETIFPHLSKNGKMMVAYMYGFNDKVKRFVEEEYQKRPEDLVYQKNIPLSQLGDYLDGFTSQNLSYAYLLDTFKNDNIETIPTENIVYGQSFDKSHDLALIVKR